MVCNVRYYKEMTDIPKSKNGVVIEVCSKILGKTLFVGLVDILLYIAGSWSMVGLIQGNQVIQSRSMLIR